MAISLVYETHSITLDNEAGVATGWLPGELSPAGRGGARELGARRRHNGLDRVVTSDLAELAREHDGERVLVIGHSATRWALQVLLAGESMCDLVEAPFAWQPGWELVVPEGFRSSFVR